jgi:hypothetical protein
MDGSDEPGTSACSSNTKCGKHSLLYIYIYIYIYIYKGEKKERRKDGGRRPDFERRGGVKYTMVDRGKEGRIIKEGKKVIKEGRKDMYTDMQICGSIDRSIDR